MLLFFVLIVNTLPVMSDTISLKMKGVSLERALLEIQRKTGYDLVYKTNLISRIKGLDFDFKAQNVEMAIEKCLEGTGLVYEKKGNSLIIYKQDLKKQFINEEPVKREIYGIVLDEQSVPIVGANVLIKGTTLGTSTDANGKYKLTLVADPDIVLVFSFIGMKSQEERVGMRDKIDVVLKTDNTDLEEVIVNGLFVQKRNSYTGSVTSISSEELLQVSNTNLIKAISVLTPGLRMLENNEMGSDPNHIPEIIIRGTTSIASNGEYGLNTPLIILDGVEISIETLYDLDINDIERVDVLKDASATAIYGEKAANGVIVIERKRVLNSKLQLRYTLTPQFSFPDVSCYDYCDAAQKLELEKRAGLYESIDGLGDVEYDRKFKRIASGVNTDWMSKPLRNSSSLNHSLGLSGRGSGMDYGITARYSNTRGVMKDDYRDNLGVGFYFSYRLVDRLTITYRSDIRKTNTKNSPYGSFSNYVILNPYDTPMDANGKWNKRLSYNMPNPLYDATTGSFSKSKSKTIVNSLNLRWDIMRGFYFTGTFNYTLGDSKSDRFTSPDHSRYVSETDPSKKGEYSISGSETNDWQLQGGIAYNHSFGDEGTIFTANLGANAAKKRSERFSFSGMGFLKSSLTDINFASGYPDSRPTGGEDLSTSVGFYANLNFIWKNRYFIDGSYRISGASKFGADKRFAPFWSVGVGWNIHNEKFLKEDGIVQILRLRGSLGHTGSVNFSDNQAFTTYKYSQAQEYYVGMGAIPITMGNDGLKWQTTISYNAGLTMEMLSNRLSVNFDVYKQVSKDLLLSVSMPPSVGVLSLMDNLGETENWGYEWAISGMPIKTSDLYWRIGISGHHTRNKLVKISNATKRQNESAKKESNLSAPKLQLEEGKSSTAIYAVPSLGIDPASGKEIFIKRDGTYTFVYDVDDKVALGDRTPLMEGAINTTFGWKGFSISATMTYTFGGDEYNETRAGKIENINPKENVDVRAFTERWVKPGDIVYYTDLMNQQNYVHSQRFIERKNELYMSSLNISYDFKPQWVKKIGLKKLRVGLGMSDIFRISTMKYERGTAYPYAHSYNFTISPTF